MTGSTSRSTDSRPASAGPILRRAMDVALACIGLLLLAPLMTMCWVLIVIVSGRPALSRERRIGLNGRPFDRLTFRTAVRSGDGSDDAVVCGILRRSGLDELPQLFNVLRGEMSVFGPRPVTEDELLRYDVLATDYLARRPGLTGRPEQSTDR